MAIAALVAALGLPVGASAGPAAACAGVTTTGDGWRRIAPAEFPFGGPRLTAYAVAPDADAIYTTNGYSVARTLDGGCTWSVVFTLPESPTAERPYSRDTATILDVVVGRSRAYLVVNDVAGPPRVLMSGDRGRTWSEAALTGIGSSLQREPRLATDVSGRHAYLLARSAQSILFTGGLAAGDVLYATSDGGATWEARTAQIGGLTGAFTSVSDLGVDPLSGNDVWVTSNAGLLHSDDAGRTWSPDATPEQGDVGPLSVAHRPGQPLQVAAASTWEKLVQLRGPGGGLTAVNTPQVVQSLAGGRVASEVAIETAGGVYELDAGRLTWALAHSGQPHLSRLSTDYSANPSFHACDCDTGAIYSRAPRRFAAPNGPVRDPGRGGVEYPGYFGCAPSKQETAPARFAPSAVLPSEDEVTLQPGESRTVRYTFRVQPRELDLYFLLDGGSRSDQFGCEARQGGVWAAAQLARIRNLRVGVGEYRDYFRPRVSLEGAIGAPNCLAQQQSDFVYRRRRAMGPADNAFKDSMAKSAVGYCAPGHAALAALLQATNGAGQDVAPSGSSPLDIARGLDAGFAPNAYKVVVNVTASWFATPQRVPGYPGPTFVETIDELVAKDVKQVGIYVAPRKKKHHDEEPVQAETGAEDLTRVALDTGTVATKPVDCGRRVKADIKIGDPLVCTYLDDGAKKRTAPPMGRQMVDLVTALRDLQPMRVGIVSGAGAGVRPAAPDAPRTLDHLLPHTLSYAVTYRCGTDNAGDVQQVEVGGSVGSTVVARATTVVRCGAPPAPRRILPDLPPQLGLIAPIAAPAAPNLPPNNLAPNTAPQPNSQPQNVANHLMQGVGVPQEEAQPRLAYANADRPPTEEQLAMSDLPRRKPHGVPPWMAVECALVMTAGAAGVAVARRRRTATAVVRTGRF